MSDTATRIQTPYLVAEDELDRSLRPRRLEAFVGQRTLREQLTVAIEASRARGDALDLDGTGATTRAGRTPDRHELRPLWSGWSGQVNLRVSAEEPVQQHDVDGNYRQQKA